MIIDSLDNVKHYRNISNRLNKGLEFLEEVDFENIEPGRYNIDGDEVFALVQEYNTKNIEDAKPETHERYIDIQYVEEGSEYMGYAPLEDQEISAAYNTEKDVAFFNAQTSLLRVDEGMFAIFFPTDIHAPGIKIEESKPVKKVVIKVLA